MRRLPLLFALACAGCADGVLRAVMPVPIDAELVLVATWDGEELRGFVLPAQGAVSHELAPILDAGRALEVWAFPVTRRALAAGAPGLARATDAEIFAGVRPIRRPARGPALALPESAVVLTGHVDADSAATVTLESAPRAEWDASPSAAIVALGVDDALACRAVSVVDFALPPDFDVRAVAAAERDRAFAVGRRGPAPFTLVELLPGGPLTKTVFGGSSPREGLSWDGESLWGIEGFREVYHLAPDGARLPVNVPPPGQAQLFAATRDGVLVALDIDFAMRSSTYVYARGAWTTIDDPGDDDIKLLRVARRDRYTVYGSCWADVWVVDRSVTPATMGWMKGRAGDGACGSPPTDLAIDDSQYLWLGRNKDLKRGLGDGTEPWALMEHGILVTSDDPWPRALAAMDEERFAVAGTEGRVEVWLGDRWCVPPPPVGVDLVAGAGRDGAAWFVGAGHAVQLKVAQP